MYRNPLCVLAGLALAVSIPTIASAQRTDEPPPPKAAGGELVYADFEKAENGQALSARGGPISLFGYQESDVHKTTFKGAPTNVGSPELVHVKAGDLNHLGKFEFGFMAPNNWAGATMEIRGQADADGKPQADDVTGYKKITFQLYATGAEMVRVEAISKGFGYDMNAGWPKMEFKVRQGLNTYEVALKSLNQPGWAEPKVDPRKILGKLTGLNITAFCEPCRPVQGIVIVDNVTFEK